MLGERIQTIQNFLKMKVREPLKIRDLNRETKGLLNISLRVETLNGKVLVEKDADLVNRNLMRVLYYYWSNYTADATLPSISLTGTDGNTRSGYIGRASATARYGKDIAPLAGYGGVGGTEGILIGTSDVAPTRTQYYLQAIIATDKITFNQQTYEELNDYSFRINREFTNALQELSVKESGFTFVAYIGGAGPYSFLGARDVFTPIVVSVGNGIRIRYTWSF